MAFARSPNSGSGCISDVVSGVPVVLRCSGSCGSGVICAEQVTRQVGRLGQRRTASQLLDLVARLDERSPPVSLAIAHPRIGDGRGEVFERACSGRHVVDLHLCPRRSAAEQGGDFAERLVGDVVDPRCGAVASRGVTLSSRWCAASNWSMLGWSVRSSKPSPSSDWRRLACRADPTRRHSERNGSTAPSPTAAAPQTVTTVESDAACPPIIAPKPPTTRTASTGPGPRSSSSPNTSSSRWSTSSRPRSKSCSRTSGPDCAGTTTAARKSTSGCRSFTTVNLCGSARSSPGE